MHAHVVFIWDSAFWPTFRLKSLEFPFMLVYTQTQTHARIDPKCCFYRHCLCIYTAHTCGRFTSSHLSDTFSSSMRVVKRTASRERSKVRKGAMAYAKCVDFRTYWKINIRISRQFKVGRDKVCQICWRILMVSAFDINQLMHIYQTGIYPNQLITNPTIRN